MNRIVLTTLALLVSTTVILSCGEDEAGSEVLTFSAGDYTGIWNSSTGSRTFSNLKISAEITEPTPGNFRGSFYISGNFRSCCGGVDDGTITFTVSDKEIVDFVWDDTINNCTGTFNGTGIITSKDAIRIEFTGTDCDGNHTGNLTLSK